MNVKLIIKLLVIGIGLLYFGGIWGLKGGYSTLIDAFQSPFSMVGIAWSLCRFLIAFYAMVFGYVLIRLSFQIIYELRIR